MHALKLSMRDSFGRSSGLILNVFTSRPRAVFLCDFIIDFLAQSIPDDLSTQGILLPLAIEE